MAVIFYRTGKHENYQGIDITIYDVDRDWSEDAYEWEIKSLKLKGEAEGFLNALEDAKIAINKKFNG